MRRILPLNSDLALLLLRVVLGIIMIYHGWPKVTGFGGVIEGFPAWASPCRRWPPSSPPWPNSAAGILMLLGVFTDIAGLLFAIDMLGAIVFVHAKNGFSAPRAASSFRWR